MTRPIGYYVHHQGDGHRQRALLIAEQAPDRFVLLGTGLEGKTNGLPYIDLPDDRLEGTDFDGRDCCNDGPQSLHYAPLRHDGVRARVSRMTKWIGATRPSLIVVDVSVEVAMLARLTGTPIVYVRLAGNRTDLPHLEAFRAAQSVLVPFHEDLDTPIAIDWLRLKTHYFPGLAADPANLSSMERSALIVFGKGGTAKDATKLVAAARAAPEFQWRALGPLLPVKEAPRNLKILGWVEDPEEEISAASVVIGGAGDGLVNAAIAAGRPFICIPEPRPFEEQLAKALRLAELNAAIYLSSWPAADLWPQLLERACALDPKNIRRLHDPHGATKAAAFLVSAAEGGIALQ